LKISKLIQLCRNIWAFYGLGAYNKTDSLPGFTTSLFSAVKQIRSTPE